MKHAGILDCTLRDGAYLVDKTFGDNTISGIIKGLVKAKIDYVEIGFLQNEGFGPGKPIFKNSIEAQKFVPLEKNGTEYAVLADYSRYSIDNLDDYNEKSFSIVRECFYKEERFEALKVFQQIKEKGYKLFVQPVGILGYTDIELIEYITEISKLEPYCFSIVDTFGSMYVEDLQRIFSLINHNLVSTCKIGFHSHNNMQMSNALSQEFLRMSYGCRDVVVDTTISGMGRGAGNTPTELVAQYMVSKLGYGYDMDALLDTIDGYMDNIRSRCDWGYSVPFFIAGSHSAHVNNISYLKKKNNIRSKDMRFILNKIGTEARKRYDYDLLESTYLDYIHSEIDDSSEIDRLREELRGKNILVLVPGNTVVSECDDIRKYVDKWNATVITVNFIHDEIEADYVYMGNIKRYNYWINSQTFEKKKKIVTSNVINRMSKENEYIISCTRLIKCGWEHLDNSTIMLLRLLDLMKVSKIGIAGFDGYDYKDSGGLNYATKYLELSNVRENPMEINREIYEMLEDYRKTRSSSCKIEFITSSRFENIFSN